MVAAADERAGQGTSGARGGARRSNSPPPVGPRVEADGLPALIGALGLLGLGAWLFHVHSFSAPSDRGVVSWVTLHAYPVQQEPVALLGALCCVLAGVALGYAFARWRGSGVALEDFASQPRGVEAAWEAAPAVAGGSGRLRAALLCGLVPLLLYVLFYDAGLIFLVPIDVLHEGERLAPLNALRHGGLPFRDFYVQHGLGQDVGKGWLAWRALDATLASLRLVECALRPLGPIALYLLGLAFFRCWPTSLALVALLGSGELGVPDRVAPGLLALAALLRALRSAGARASLAAAAGPSRWAGLSGLLAALAFCHSAEVGLYAIAASAGGAILLLAGSSAGPQRSARIRLLRDWSFGLVLGLLPLLLFLLWHDALPAFLANCRVQFGLQRLVWALPFPSLWEALALVRSPADLFAAEVAGTLLFYLPPAIYLAEAGALLLCALRGRFRASTRPALRLVTLLFGLALFYSALSRSDSSHLTFAMAPAGVLALGALEGAVAGARRGQAGGVFLRLAALATAALSCGVWFALQPTPLPEPMRRLSRLAHGLTLPASNRGGVWSPLGTMGAAPERLRYLRGVSDFIRERTPEGEPFFDFTNQPAFYFFADRPQASRYGMIAYAATPELEREVIAELERTRPRVVLFRVAGGADRMDGVPIARRHPRVAAYLRAHYGPGAQIGRAVLLERREQAGSAQPSGSERRSSLASDTASATSSRPKGFLRKR